MMKILVVLSRFPYPLEKGDKLRAYHQIRCLAEHHDLYLAAMHDKPVSDDALNQLKPFCKEIFLLENNNLKRCWNMGRAFSRACPSNADFSTTNPMPAVCNRLWTRYTLTTSIANCSAWRSM